MLFVVKTPIKIRVLNKRRIKKRLRLFLIDLREIRTQIIFK
jgi:hypothetical protein